MSDLNELEKETLEKFRGGTVPAAPLSSGDREGWIRFGLSASLQICSELRDQRRSWDHDGVERKPDGTPSIRIETKIEEDLRARLNTLDFPVALIGEETGGKLPVTGCALAVDPIDGTWSFLGETETHSVTLAIFHDGEALIGLVANPVTGELAYGDGRETRLIQISVFGESDGSRVLPVEHAGKGKILVNAQPAKKGHEALAAVFEAWSRNEIGMVRSPGGSPAWALVEAAKGHFIYVNLWGKQTAEPWDLAAGNLILRGAGGRIIDQAGADIDVLKHSGLLIAGVDQAACAKVAALLKKS